MSIVKAPLYQALISHWERRPRSFHVPGHRFGTGIPADLRGSFEQIMRLDVTELSDTDNLHHAEGAIRDAQELAADCFGAEETHFLVGGSTAGNIAMLLAVCEPGELVLVQRNVHRSVLNGLMLAGAVAVFVSPQEDPKSGIATVPSLEAVQEALNRYPDAKAVLLTNPNYYGMSVDLAEYAAAIHLRGIPLLVDEAHGAHYGLHPAFPSTSLKQGADAVVQSTHKTLTAMTMGAMLHVQGARLDRDKLRRSLAMIQSSSPSYPIMASLDIARAMIDQYGGQLFASAIEEAYRFREATATRLPVFNIAHTSEPYRQDPLRIVMRDRTASMTGYQLLHELENRGCWAEMADAVHVVLLFGIGTTADDTDTLIASITDIVERNRLDSRDQLEPYGGPHHADRLAHGAMIDPISGPVRLSHSMPAGSRTVPVPLGQAAGRMAAELIVPYPPGIPLLYPGERITASAVHVLAALSNAGAKCQGAEDPSMRTIRVYRADEESQR